jgi:nicotinamide-nucleotide adenylyltransferase
LLSTSLFVGRFQPLHLGHLAAIEYALKKTDRLVIAVGSAEKSFELRNPFSAGERLEMLHLVLQARGLQNRIITATVPDVDNHELWVPLVVSLVPRFELVFSNDYLTVALFKKAGFRVEEVPLLRREELMATEVRRRMAEGGDWSSLVPKEAAEFIVRTGGDKRVKALSEYNQANGPKA